MQFRRAWVPLTLLVAVGCTAPTTSPSTTGTTQSPSPSGNVATPSAAPSTASTQKMLQGKVFDEDMGAVAGATVTASLSGQEPVKATTGTDGAYSLALPPGDYTVDVSKDGWTTRSQTVKVSGDSTLNFGGLEGDQFNPYFLSTTPEIAKVDVQEQASGGPMTIVMHLSEALTSTSQQDFLNRLELVSGISTAFLEANGSTDDLLKLTPTWDAAGKNLTLQYAGPYLASGETAAVYTLRLHQNEKDQKDPLTGDTLWEAMDIKDSDGHPLGYDRADYAFVKPTLFPITYAQIANKDLGTTPAVRRWGMSHQPTFTFSALKDDKGPGLESVRVNSNMQIGSATWDVLELHFTEPMWAVKDRDHLQFTQLDKDKQMVLLSVSKSANGDSPQPFGSDFTIQSIRFSRLDPNVVYLQYSPDAFKDQKWVEVTLGVDMKDPAGNKADSAKSRLSGPVS